MGDWLSTALQDRYWIADLAAGVVSFAGFAAYNIQLLRRTASDPQSSAKGRHAAARRAWVHMMAGGGHDLLAIHTMRNWIMSSTFLASTAILFALGLLAAAFTSDKLSAFAHALNLLGSTSQGLWLFKSLALVVAFVLAFYAFVLAVRAFVHFGFMINVIGSQDRGVAATNAADELERGATQYWIGMRCYYAAAPLALWLFGPLWMLFGTLALIWVLRHVD
ncbi:MAG: DUF599 domain-containing protein [Alphaproteobacteria bacterium]